MIVILRCGDVSERSDEGPPPAQEHLHMRRRTNGKQAQTGRDGTGGHPRTAAFKERYYLRLFY